MSNGIFGKDNKFDDKTKRDQVPGVPGVMTQRNATAAAPQPAPAPAPQPTAAPTTQAAAVSGSTLTVGPNIKLKSAEITDCDTLVVEGHVDGTVSSQAIVIAETGTLNGTATIDNAEIRGEFKGELTVKKRLMILPDTLPVAQIIRRFFTVSSPLNSPRISALSMVAVPFSVPVSAITIAWLETVPSTWPSTTSVSQSVISALFNLMLGPTVSVLPVR